MFKTILLAATIFVSLNFANAQFNKLKSEISKTNNLSSENTNTTISNSSMKGAGVLDDVLLDYINYDYRRKTIVIEQARAMNLSTDGTDVKVTLKVKSADGKTLGTYEANALAPKRNKSYWMRGFLGTSDTEVQTTLSGAGDYFLEFSANGKVFDQFPFTLTPYTSDKGEFWFLIDGLWNDHAAIDSSKDFKFSVWMRDMLEGTGKRSINYGKYSAKIVREKDSKVIGTTASHVEDQTLAPSRNWKRYDITFVKDKQTGGAIGIYDVTAQEGNYYVEFIHDGKLYGNYPFKVQGGKLQGVIEFRSTGLETSGGDVTWLKRAGGK